jgi:hypothetical protein
MAGNKPPKKYIKIISRQETNITRKNIKILPRQEAKPPGKILNYFKTKKKTTRKHIRGIGNKSPGKI